MSTKDDQLLLAVEADDVERVRRLLAEGADASARKRATLRVQVTGEGEMTDSAECESALGIASAFGRAGVAEALLGGGADPNAEVQWKVPVAPPSSTWRAGMWSKRWIVFKFPSALAVAIGRGGTGTVLNSTEEASWTKEIDTKGHVLASVPGAHINLDRSTSTDVVDRTITPTPSLVRALLRHGARVTAADVAAAGKLPDPQIRRILEEHLANLPPAAAGPAEGAVAGRAAAEARAAELQAQLDAALARAAAAEARAASAEARLADLQAQLDAAAGRAADAARRAGGRGADVRGPGVQD